MNLEYKIPEENILGIMHGFVREKKNYKQQKVSVKENLLTFLKRKIQTKEYFLTWN